MNIATAFIKAMLGPRASFKNEYFHAIIQIMSIAYSSFLGILKNCLCYKGVPYLTQSVIATAFIKAMLLLRASFKI